VARILVAEQHPQARRFLLGVLEFGGHDVVEAANGERALMAIGFGRIDVVLAELRLPGLTGASLVRAAARFDETLPCLVLCGFGDLSAIDEALEAGAIGIVPKPATARQVLCCVARADERRLLARAVAPQRRELRGLTSPWRVSEPTRC
jgi:DNA-binding NtrC family response regulator